MIVFMVPLSISAKDFLRATNPTKVTAPKINEGCAKIGLIIWLKILENISITALIRETAQTHFFFYKFQAH